jgi:hypothetical protein
MKLLIRILNWLRAYSYCDGCGITIKSVYTYYPVGKEFPVFYCNTCFKTYKNEKSQKRGKSQHENFQKEC